MLFLRSDVHVIAILGIFKSKKNYATQPINRYRADIGPIYFLAVGIGNLQ